MSQTATIKVWDPVVRISHWLVVGCVMANLLILESGSELHRWLGYTACAAVVIRTLWGFVGTRHARFSDWFPTPKRLLPYVKQLLDGREPRMLGHNPAGALMMLLLWGLILALGVSGYMMGTDAWFGEEWLEELHEAIANTLIVAVILHVAAAIFESCRHRENLVRSMVTGRKRPLYDDNR